MPVLSNHAVARNLVVIVDTKDTATEVVADNLAGWLARVVNQCYPVKPGEFPHKVVAGTWRSDRIVAVVHQTSDEFENSLVFNSKYGPGDLTVVNEQASPPAKLAADVVAQRIDVDPPAVELAGLGVSGVSDQYASEVWAEIISKERDWMDGSGKGYMVHPMFLWDEQSGVSNVREMSFNFGWSPQYYRQVGAPD